VIAIHFPFSYLPSLQLVSATVNLQLVDPLVRTPPVNSSLSCQNGRVDRAEFEKGINLINNQHFFEAHEVLEDLWRPMPLDDPHRPLMQGLVQIAVALHHCSTGNRTGALSVMRRAANNIAPAERNALNIRFDLLRPAIEVWIAEFDRDGESPRPIPILFVS
jgi:DUF309 family protein family protein